MRTRTLSVAAIAASGLLLAGCKPTTATVNTNAANTGSATTAAAAAKPAGLGAAIDVTDDSGDKLAVTLVKVDAHVTATDGFSTPPAGDSYYAVQVQIKDIGSTAWQDSPSNCMTVKDGKGQQFTTDLVQAISSGPLMQASVSLAAGATALGWIVFDVPTGDTVTTAQFTTDSGMGSDVAQWAIG